MNVKRDLPLALVFVALGINLMGCGPRVEDTPKTSALPEITNPSEIVAAVKQAMAMVKSYRVDTISDMTANDKSITNHTKITALVDTGRWRFYLQTYLLVTGSRENVEQLRESYWVDGWVYQVNRPTSIPSGISTAWLKYLDPDVSQNPASFSTVQTMLGMLESSKIDIQGSERVNGIECYKLGLTGDFFGSVPPEYPATFSEIKVFVWVSKADFRLVKQLMTYNVTANGLVYKASNDVTFSQYDQTIINLPAEALSASEVAAPRPPTTTQPPINLPEVINGVKKAVSTLKSYNLMLVTNNSEGGKSTLQTLANGKVDTVNQVYYLDQRVNRNGSSPQRTEYYFSANAAYERRDYSTESYQSGTWYKHSGTGSSVPLFATNPQRLADLLGTATVSAGQGGANGVDCYTLHVRDHFSDYLTQDPSQLNNLEFVVFVAKDSFQIIMVSISYSRTENGVTTEYRSTLGFSDFNQISVQVPPEALNATEVQGFPPQPTLP